MTSERVMRRAEQLYNQNPALTDWEHRPVSFALALEFQHPTATAAVKAADLELTVAAARRAVKAQNFYSDAPRTEADPTTSTTESSPS